MSTETLFVQAARKRLRFQSNKGQVSVEDLWDLSLESLDSIAVAVNDVLEKEGKKSFIAKRTTSSTENTLKLDILKFVIETKQAENEARKTRAETATKVAQLEEVLLKKQEEKLGGLTEEELLKQIAALKGK